MGAIEARKGEGITQNDPHGAIHAFDLWEPVYIDCVSLESEFYHCKHIKWAKRRTVLKWCSTFFFGILTASAGQAFLKDPLVAGLKIAKGFLLGISQ